jgi:hypothetical protein
MLLKQLRKVVGCACAFFAQTPPLLLLVLPQDPDQEADAASGIFQVLTDP